VGNSVKLEALIGLVGRLNSGSDRLVDVINIQVTSVRLALLLRLSTLMAT